MLGPGAIVALVLISAAGSLRAAGNDPAPAVPAPELETLATVKFDQRIDWQMRSEAGFLHVYSGGRLQTFDLVDGGRRAGEPIELPGAGHRSGVVYLPGTSLLLITRADEGSFLPPGSLRRETKEPDPLSTAYDSGATPERARSSYGIDFVAGKILWEGLPLGTPDAVVFYEKENLALIRAGSHGRDLTAIDLGTGRHLWTQHLDVQYAGLHSGWLEVFGEESGVLDPLTGKRFRAFRLPTSPADRIFTFPSGDRVVVWEWDDFQAWSFPPLAEGSTAESLPATIEAKRLWKLDARGLMQKNCVLLGVCWAHPVGDDRLLVGSAHSIELIDIDTGKRLWRRDKSSYVRDLPVSPSGRVGALLSGGDLVLVDMETGKETLRTPAPKAPSSSKRQHLLRWLSDSELVVVYHDPFWIPVGVTRFDIAGGRLLYNTELPEGAHFRLTARQKGSIAVAVFVGVALVAAGSAATPIPTVPMPGHVVMQSLDSLMVGPGSVHFLVPGTEPRSASPMSRRAVERRRQTTQATRTELFLVSGRNDVYRVVAVDLDDGSQRAVGFYSRPKVHSIALDIADGLAISLEENETVLRFLRLPR